MASAEGLRISESEGLRKLTEYLNQTRRQAETAIDALNAQVQQLSQDCDKYRDECVYYKRCCEQLQQENSKKWRLHERDDWKSLVESVQKDRNRLQDECLKLELEKDQYKNEMAVLQEQLKAYQQNAIQSPVSTEVGVSTPLKPGVDHGGPQDEAKRQQQAAIDRSTIKRLEVELEKCRTEVRFAAYWYFHNYDRVSLSVDGGGQESL